MTVDARRQTDWCSEQPVSAGLRVAAEMGIDIDDPLSFTDSNSLCRQFPSLREAYEAIAKLVLR